MTIITLTTVGFAEVHPVGPQARVLTIAVIISGIGVGGYLVGTITQILIEGRLLHIMGRKKLQRQIQALKGHYVICGYGRVGRIVCEEIKKSKPPPLVVIETSRNLYNLLYSLAFWRQSAFATFME